MTENDEALWPGFGDKLCELINIHGIDNDLKTPDYILARYIIVHLITVQSLIESRDDHAA